MTQYIPSMILAAIAAGAVWFFVDVFVKAGSAYRDRFKERASRNLSSMFLFIEAEKLFVMNLIMVVAVFIVTLAIFGNIYVSLVLAAAVGASPPLVFRFMRKRRIEQAIQQLPDTLMSVSSGMRSGQSLQQAMETVVSFEKGAVSQELGLFLRELRVGTGFNEALDNLYTRLPRVEIQLVVAAMKIARETGSNLSETLERIASTLRSRLQMEGKIRSLTSQGRLQGLVMAGLPIGMALILFKMQPSAMSYLFTTWYGWVVVVGILTLDGIGYFFVRKIVDIDV